VTDDVAVVVAVVVVAEGIRIQVVPHSRTLAAGKAVRNLHTEVRCSTVADRVAVADLDSDLAVVVGQSTPALGLALVRNKPQPLPQRTARMSCSHSHTPVVPEDMRSNDWGLTCRQRLLRPLKRSWPLDLTGVDGRRSDADLDLSLQSPHFQWKRSARAALADAANSSDSW